MKFFFPKILGFVAPAPAAIPQDEIAIVLNRAADIIEEKGLARTTFAIQPDGSMCTYTAIREACKERGLENTDILYDAETRMVQQVGQANIAHWTDDLSFFAKERVVWNLRRAAKRV